MRSAKLTDMPQCPRCRRKALPEWGADNLSTGSGGLLVKYWCPWSTSWHVWSPRHEPHQDVYAR